MITYLWCLWDPPAGHTCVVSLLLWKYKTTKFESLCMGTWLDIHIMLNISSMYILRIFMFILVNGVGRLLYIGDDVYPWKCYLSITYTGIILLSQIEKWIWLCQHKSSILIGYPWIIDGVLVWRCEDVDDGSPILVV